MVILSSPSGAGKTTLVKLLSKNKNFDISISHTTRKPRPDEVNKKEGSSYFDLVSDDDNDWDYKKKKTESAFGNFSKLFNKD